MESILKILIVIMIGGHLSIEEINQTHQTHQTHSTDVNINSINEIVDTLLMDTLINAVSIGIYNDGEEIIKHYGELDKGKNNPPTDKTIYEIASVTKTLTGLLVAQAEMEGKLSIEDDVQKYLGSKYSNLSYEGVPLKIKHLLTHTAGLPLFFPESINDLFDDITDELPFQISEIESKYSKSQFLNDLETVSLDTIPGTRFSYGNIEIIGFILEKVYEKSLDEILVDKICNASNMPDTRIKLNEEQKIRLANGYFGSNVAPHMNTQLWGPGGGGKSTMPDLLNYMKLQLDKSNEAVQQTHQILYDKEVIYGDPDNKIGYYWIINKDDDWGKYMYHHGGAFGMQNLLFIYPEKNIGMSIITNQGDWQIGGKIMHVINGIQNVMKKSP